MHELVHHPAHNTYFAVWGFGGHGGKRIVNIGLEKYSFLHHESYCKCTYHQHWSRT